MGLRRFRDPTSSVHSRTLALVATLWLGAVTSAQDVASSNRRFTARLRPLGAPTEIEVVDFEQGGEPVASVVWKAKGLDLGSSDVWCLTDDGKVLAAIATKGTADRPLVRIVREGKLLVALGAGELALDPALLDGWLVPDVPNLRVREGGTSPRLDLLARDEGVRSIDLMTGAVTWPRAEPVLGSLRVEPEAEPGAEGSPYVSNWLAPEVLFAGEPLRVHVRGNLPTPAHRIAGFTIERQGPGIGLLLLSPRMQDPPPDTIAPQVLEPFDQTASVLGLAPGRHRLTVAGRGGETLPDVRELCVLPAGVACSLEITGGIAGVQRSIRLFEDGRVVASPDPSGSRVVFLASDAQRREVARAVELLPSAAAKRPRTHGADMFSYGLVWTVSGRPVLAERDDGNLEPQLRELVATLEKLALEPEPGSRYAIDAAKSFIDVRTGSAGLLSAFGHDHKLMVRRLSGTVLADPADLAAASVVLEIEAASLAVVDDDSAGDRVEIEREMNEHVLEVGKHPTIRFESRKVEATPTLAGAFDLVVQGDLSLHGKTRRIRVPGRLEVRPDSLRFRGTISLLQSDYGIETSSAVGGTVNVADKVRIGFDVTAVREAGRVR